MTRTLYQLLLWLHPPAFRRRFYEEMLSIFEEGSTSDGAWGLLLDGLLSLTRQWLGRTGLWKVAFAIGIAFLQSLWFALPRKGFHPLADNRQPTTPYLQDLMVVTLVVISGLFLLVLLLALWTTHFPPRRFENRRMHRAEFVSK